MTLFALWLNGVAWLRNGTKREGERTFRAVIIHRGVLEERTQGNGRNGRVHAHACQKEKKKLCSRFGAKRWRSPNLLKPTPRHASFISVNRTLFSIYPDCEPVPGLIRAEGESVSFWTETAAKYFALRDLERFHCKNPRARKIKSKECFVWTVHTAHTHTCSLQQSEK